MVSAWALFPAAVLGWWVAHWQAAYARRRLERRIKTMAARVVEMTADAKGEADETGKEG